MSETFNATIIGSNGTTIALSGSLTPSAPVIIPPPVIVTPPVVVAPPVVTPPVLAALSVTALPVFPGQLYTSDSLEIPGLPNGFHDFSQVVPPNAPVVSNASNPAHLPTDFTDFNSAMGAAIANGSGFVLFLDGDTYGTACVNGNFCGINGSSTKWVGFGRTGRKGITDLSAGSRPVLLNGIGVAGSPANGKNYGGPLSHFAAFGIDFYADQRDPASKTFNKAYAGQVGCIQMIDQSWGGASDHIVVEDCRGRFFQKMLDFESAAAYSMNTVAIWRCTGVGCYGQKFTAFDYHVRDCLVVQSLFDNSGWNETAAPKADPTGMEQGFYTAINPTTETADPQHRYIGCCFSRADSEGLEGNAGGLIDTSLFLANSIAGYVGVYQSGIHNCVVDGGGDGKGGNEFDFAGANGIMIGSALTLSTATLPVPPKIDANTRGWGLFLDACPSGFLDSVTVINKPEVVNCGFALGVRVADPAKQLKSLATIAAVTNCKVYNWYTWSSSYPDPTKGAPNVLNLNGPPNATIAYSGNYFPGVTGVAGVTGTIPNYVDPTRCARTYAQSIGLSGAPALLAEMQNQSSFNWSPALAPDVVVNWIQAGFEVGP
jgi:hypothetical protein